MITNDGFVGKKFGVEFLMEFNYVEATIVGVEVLI